MARTESFTYNGYVVGGASSTDNTQIVGERFGWSFDAEEGDEVAEFVCEFILVGSSASDLETKCTAMLATLRTKYQKLSVDWANNIATYDPAVANATGWDARPKVTKSRRRTRDTKLTRGFEFRLRVDLPSNYTDANLSGAAAAGRRTSTVALRWDSSSRRVVSISGQFHQTAAQLPRAKTTTAAMNNPTGPIDTYCVARLAKIDPTVEWTIGARDEEDNNTQTTLRFTRQYFETIHGRFVATPDIGYMASRQRIVTIRGTFFRTYSATYDGSATRAASVNYADNTNGGYAYALVQLAALTTAQGGPLEVGTTCELIAESATPNDQDDRLDYLLVFRELLFKQSNSATSLDDPEVVVDSIRYVLDYEMLDDSKVQPGGGGGPNPFSPVPALAGGGGKPANTSGGSTLEKPAITPDNPGGGPGSQSGQLPVKPVKITIDYRTTIAKTVTDLRVKYYSAIRPWLLGQFAAELGFSPTFLADEHFEEDATSNTLAGTVICVALQGDVIAYKVEDSVSDELGLWADEALTGTPYEYLLQQELPNRNKIRKHQVFYKTGSSFDPATLATQPSVPGYIVLRRSAPVIRDVTRGVPNLGVNTQGLTYVEFVEALLYVARNVGDAPGTLPSGAASSGNPAAVRPDNPGGV